MTPKQYSHKKILIILLPSIFILLILIIGFTILPNFLSKQNESNSSIVSPITQNGLDYLRSQINTEIWLLREAPEVAPNIYWITNDNSLAGYVFYLYGYTDISKNIQNSIQEYGSINNNFIEVVYGKVIDFPPSIAEPVLVNSINQAEVWNELHDSGPVFEDWQEYANLGFMGALNYNSLGDFDLARDQVKQTMQMFNGIGFHDKSFDGNYETYKLALALYSANKIGVELDNSKELTELLIKMQNENGGFHTHYDENLEPLGDTNTETTAFALLALGVFE